MTPVQLRFVHWILEREKAREAKDLGEPYKGDPIIQAYRFCNVNREHDRVTKWINEHVRPHLVDVSLGEAIYRLYLCRVFNEPDCLEDIMPDVAHKTALKRLQMRRRAELKLLRGAYLVVPHGESIDVEIYYMNLAARLRKLDISVGGLTTPTLEYVAKQMLPLTGMGEFMVNQVISDLRYQQRWGLDWHDWETFVMAGPGTRRGLARYRATGSPKRQPNGRIAKETGDCGAYLRDIRRDLKPHLPHRIWMYLRDINNLSNCFCEFDKYERARDGEASLRHYTPTQD
jgi:hypothetical protein